MVYNERKVSNEPNTMKHVKGYPDGERQDSHAMSRHDPKCEKPTPISRKYVGGVVRGRLEDGKGI